MVEQREDLIKQILLQINQPLWSDWMIKERIGIGSFSEVYKIEAKRNGKKFVSALKIEPLVANRVAYSKKDKEQYIEKAVELAENEINIMYQLRDCQNIVRYEEEQRNPFYYHGQFEGYYQLIRMEFLFCVEDLLKKGEFELSENNIRKLALEIGNGISALHKKGIMHRDIKPGNLFLDEEKVYKLGDFSISKQSETGCTIAGTDGYMAPEIYYKTENSEMIYTKQTDIYSFGITLYYLMNDLQFPFENTGMNLEQALYKRMSGMEFSPPRNASKEFGEIICRACAYKPEERFQTADEILEAIWKLPETENIFIKKADKKQNEKDIVKYEEIKKIQKIQEKEKKEKIIIIQKKKWIIEGILLTIAITVIILSFNNRLFKISESFYSGEVALEKDQIKKDEKSNKLTNIEIQDALVETEIENDKNDFVIEDGVLKEYKGNKKDIVIPDDVIDIGEKAFIHYSNLKSIKMPNTVESIGFSAFAWCENLEDVQMSDNITAMEKNVFRGCKKLKSIVIPKGIKKIKMRSFQDCKALEYVEISEGVEIVGCLAFDGCKELKEIALPNTMKKVDTWAFSRCKNLEKVIVPNEKTKFLWEALEKKVIVQR